MREPRTGFRLTRICEPDTSILELVDSAAEAGDSSRQRHSDSSWREQRSRRQRRGATTVSQAVTAALRRAPWLPSCAVSYRHDCRRHRASVRARVRRCVCGGSSVQRRRGCAVCVCVHRRHVDRGVQLLVEGVQCSLSVLQACVGVCLCAAAIDSILAAAEAAQRAAKRADESATPRLRGRCRCQWCAQRHSERTHTEAMHTHGSHDQHNDALWSLRIAVMADPGASA